MFLRALIKPVKAAQALWRRFPVGPFQLRLAYDIFPHYAYYAYGIYYAALMASRLGLRRISSIEFGVAGGNGLVAMEKISEQVENETGVKVEVYGFDTGSGLYAPADFRDEPYVYQSGNYGMDKAALESRLSSAKLLLGDVKDTVPEFREQASHATIGFVSFDLDYYSATTDALKIFTGGDDILLPRVLCYFDDTIGLDLELHNEWTGVLLAIAEFNKCRGSQKIAPINGLSSKRVVPARWNQQMYALHSFEHPLYNQYILREDQQLPLSVAS